ncbi:alpha,alpha-trehalose-phosphate synthase (UDP-forming) [Nesterenkonia sp. PF2B19]|uniref:alpha,alpha-trehalose-phosphate synthase (UDP-forming) n=1 Tax=Nesterenkonia sp. PF2B19 TaxID=1881858 RepID=UPI000872272A|nr:trehalose-6-phosphate synthase [Nesterenkonia sp. PF2B19]OSM42550.1 trehalose-6-phosphate synthase [Nesterenkonia sp. PF2B19]
MAQKSGYDFVVVANRLAVDRITTEDGGTGWRRSPGGLVTALAPIMAQSDGAWVGWHGAADETLEPFDHAGMHLVPVRLSEQEVEDYYEGFSNATLWPLYHDVIARPEFHRHWFEAYRRVNRRFAEAAAAVAAEGATIWVQDYQLQLVPAMLRELRPDVRIGFFNHIPFPPPGLFSQLPWRHSVLRGLLGADLIGFQRESDARNFQRVVRHRLGYYIKSDQIYVPSEEPEPDQLSSLPGLHPDPARGTVARQAAAPQQGDYRIAEAKAFPISIDTQKIVELAERPDIIARSEQIRRELGNPETIFLGVDRLDYTKGIRHRMKAYEELLADGELTVGQACLVQVASPSREGVESYRLLREEIESTVGRINGEYDTLAHTAIRYLHHSYPVEEMVALYLAADVMLVTALRDGMNLVAKEYVAARKSGQGVLVLSEFTGAADQMRQALLINPHDVDELKTAMVKAATMEPENARRRMRSLRRQVVSHNVQRWAEEFLERLAELR